MIQWLKKLFGSACSAQIPTVAMPDPLSEQYVEWVWRSSAARDLIKNGGDSSACLRIEFLRREIARLKRNKKRWTHLQAELDTLTTAEDSALAERYRPIFEGIRDRSGGAA